MKKNIALVAGGDSAEFEISLQTAQNIQKALDRTRYIPYLVIMQGLNWHVEQREGDFPIDRNDFSFTKNGKKITFDFVYNAIHGTPGENGILQGYLELLKIPHSSCDVLSSALCFNKHMCKTYLKSLGFLSAKSIFLRSGDNVHPEAIVKQLGIPCFVKPNAYGSSFGITKVKKETELMEAIRGAFLKGSEVIIEEFLDGMEVTCGLMKTGRREIIFPVTEIIPKTEFFDYDAKYNPKMADEITPARISTELTQRIQQLSSKIYDALQCKGIVRLDYIVCNSEIYFLENNTVPGMTENSLVPKQIQAMNRELKDVLTELIESIIPT